MSTVAVARKDFADAARSRMLWAVMALFTLFTAGGIVAFDKLFEEFPPLAATHALAVPATKIIPITALIVGYLAIAGERESGSIRVLLGLPGTRRDVVLGKLLGRTGVVAVAIVAAFVAGAVTITVLSGTVPIVEVLKLTFLTVLFGLAYVGIALGISAATSTRSRAMAGAISVFAVFSLLWNFIPLAVHYLIEGGLPSGKVPAWYLLFQRLNPENAYNAASQFLLENLDQNYFVSGSGASSSAAESLDQLVQGGAPFFVENWFALVILAAWIVVPVALGYWRFERVDIG